MNHGGLNPVNGPHWDKWPRLRLMLHTSDAQSGYNNGLHTGASLTSWSPEVPSAMAVWYADASTHAECTLLHPRIFTLDLSSLKQMSKQLTSRTWSHEARWVLLNYKHDATYCRHFVWETLNIPMQFKMDLLMIIPNSCAPWRCEISCERTCCWCAGLVQITTPESVSGGRATERSPGAQLGYAD